MAKRRPAWPVASLPSNTAVPVSGWSKPVRRLKNVVFPAPLGPMRAVITPRWTSRWSTSTAINPPNARLIFSTTRIGAGLGTPGSQAIPSNTSAGIECHLLTRTEDALRSEDHEQCEGQTHDPEPDLVDLARVHDRGRDVSVVHELPARVLDEGDGEPVDDRAHHRCPDPSNATQDQDQPEEEGERGNEEVRLHGGVPEGLHHSAEPSDDATEDQGLQLVPVGVLPERPGGVLVLTDRLDHTTPRRAHQLRHEQQAEGDEDPAHEDGEELGATPLEPAETVGRPSLEGAQLPERADPLVQALGSSGDG